MDTTNAKTETRNFKLELELLRKDRKQQEDILSTVAKSFPKLTLEEALAGPLVAFSNMLNDIDARIEAVKTAMRGNEVEALYATIRAGLEPVGEQLKAASANMKADVTAMVTVTWKQVEVEQADGTTSMADTATISISVAGSRKAAAPAAKSADGLPNLSGKRGVEVSVNGVRFASGRVALDAMREAWGLDATAGHAANAVKYVEGQAKKHGMSFERHD